MLKWGLLLSIFLTAVNRENGSLQIDPLDALAYPSKTYEGLRILQNEFIRHIKEEADKAMKRSGRKR